MAEPVSWIFQGAPKEIALAEKGGGIVDKQALEGQDHPPFVHTHTRSNNLVAITFTITLTLSFTSQAIQHFLPTQHYYWSHKQSKWMIRPTSAGDDEPSLNGDMARPRTKRNFMDGMGEAGQRSICKGGRQGD